MNSWLAGQIGESAANIITSLIVLIVVIVAIVVTVTILRKLNSGTFVVGGNARTPRLSVRDAAAVDRTRRLVLVRRDNVEHLILIGGPTDVVIETNITSPDAQKETDNLEAVQPQAVVKDDPRPRYQEPQLKEPAIPPHKPESSHFSQLSTKPAAPRPRDPLSMPQLDNTDRTSNLNIGSSHLTAEPQLSPVVERPFSSRANPTRPVSQKRQDPLMRQEPMPSLQDDIITDEIEGRREPSLKSVSPTTLDSAPSIDDEFDRMFEDELKQAVRNDK